MKIMKRSIFGFHVEFLLILMYDSLNFVKWPNFICFILFQNSSCFTFVGFVGKKMEQPVVQSELFRLVIWEAGEIDTQNVTLFHDLLLEDFQYNREKQVVTPEWK